MNSPYTAPKARLVVPAAKRFDFRAASAAYLVAVTTLVTLVLWLGWVVSGEFPTARGYWILWSYATISSAFVALVGGKLIRRSLLGAIGVGVAGGLFLLAVITMAAFAVRIFYRVF
ncbi:MAG: hypothetical protein ACOY82_17415 [Pseudomonadota bacterium]